MNEQETTKMNILKINDFLKLLDNFQKLDKVKYTPFLYLNLLC